MDDKQLQDDVIDLTRYVDFLKRRKWCVGGAALLCLAGSFLYASLTPTVYKISAIIEPPSVESQQSLAIKINEGVFEGEPGKIINSLAVKAGIIHPTELIRLYSQGAYAKDLSGHIELMNKLLTELAQSYQSEIDLEKENIERQIGTIRIPHLEEEKELAGYIKNIAEAGDKSTASSIHILYNELLFLKYLFVKENIQRMEQLRPAIQNIKVIKKPHVSEEISPRIDLSLALGLFTGIVLGVIIGFIKDVSASKKV